MEELIKVHEENGQFPINARELWETLQVGRDFSTWIKCRIQQYGFIKNIDFVVVKPSKSSLPKTGEGIGSAFDRIDYKLTLNMGKEIAMLENNEIGRTVRRYLIAVEEHYNQLIAPKISEIRQIAKKKRLSFTDTLLGHGANKPHHYINITKGMKKCLGIPETKPKTECNDLEVMAIAISEDLATLSIIKNNPQGYYECRDQSFSAADKVKELTDTQDRLTDQSA